MKKFIKKLFESFVGLIAKLSEDSHDNQKNKNIEKDIDDNQIEKQKGDNMLEYLIENVPYYSQRNNKFDPKISCFPTSLAMVMKYCLLQEGKNKSHVGCSPNMLLEDYINTLIDDDETKEWMIRNEGRLGSWIWKYRRRTIYAVEAYIFNRLMNRHGYEAQKRFDFNYQTICNILRETELPMIIGGNFSSVSSVGGHMNTLIGYNAIGLKEFIVHDPYGNALTGYEDHNGDTIRYDKKFFKRDGDKIYCIYFKKM